MFYSREKLAWGLLEFSPSSFATALKKKHISLKLFIHKMII